MRILEEVVERYLRDLRPERSEVMTWWNWDSLASARR
jgi:hypothetical protein